MRRPAKVYGKEALNRVWNREAMTICLRICSARSLQVSWTTSPAMFTDSLGFSRVLDEISIDPSSDHLRRTLDKWLGSSERDPSDWVVFYYTGHGELVGDNLYLLTRDSEYEALVATAFSAEQLAQMLISRGTHGDKRPREKLAVDT